MHLQTTDDTDTDMQDILGLGPSQSGSSRVSVDVVELTKAKGSSESGIGIHSTNS